MILKELKLENEQLIEKNTELNDENKRLNDELDNALKLIAKLENDLIELKNKNLNLNKTVLILSRELGEVKRLLSQKNQRIIDLEDMVKSLETNLTIATKEILKLNNINLEDCVFIYNNSNSNISNVFSNDEKFDYIYLNSVFTHTPYKDIDDILKQFKKILNKSGKIIFSAHLKERNPTIKKTIKDFYYSYEELSFLAKKNNLSLDELVDWPDHKCPMFKLQLI